MCDIKFVSVVNDNNNDYKICRLDRNDTGLYQLRMNSISILIFQGWSGSAIVPGKTSGASY